VQADFFFTFDDLTKKKGISGKSDKIFQTPSSILTKKLLSETMLKRLFRSLMIN